jgi:hypothetical protein
MRKGYLFIAMFALFLSTTQTLKYRIYIKKDYNEVSLEHLLLQGAVLFAIFFLPGLFLVRWYYKQKDKNTK